MPATVLILPDKFKGTLTAPAAAGAMARGWRRARPGDALQVLPISDGGDGFGAVMGGILKARARSVRTVNAAHRSQSARWWWEPRTKTAVIESANVIGLALLRRKKFHPFRLDTFGLGAVIRAASAQGARTCLVGIGGSATNDGGFGLARSLGWEFLDSDGKPITRWTGLSRLAEIRAPKRRRWFRRLIVAMDVQNPLLGPKGATRIYGPQKGLRRRELAFAEKCLRRLAHVFRKKFGRDFASVPGAGAAGGLGFGLLAFLGARPESGFRLVARRVALERQLRRADLVITGEGKIDASTFMGKGVGEIVRRCRRWKIPCLVFAGTADRKIRRVAGGVKIYALTDLATVAEAEAKPEKWLRRLATQAAARKSDVGNRK